MMVHPSALDYLEGQARAAGQKQHVRVNPVWLLQIIAELRAYREPSRAPKEGT